MVFAADLAFRYRYVIAIIVLRLVTTFHPFFCKFSVILVPLESENKTCPGGRNFIQHTGRNYMPQKNEKQKSATLLMSQGVTGSCGGIGTILVVLDVVCIASSLDRAFYFIFVSLIADGDNQRATTLPMPRVVSRNLPISPRFTPTNF